MGDQLSSPPIFIRIDRTSENASSGEADGLLVGIENWLLNGKEGSTTEANVHRKDVRFPHFSCG